MLETATSNIFSLHTDKSKPTRFIGRTICYQAAVDNLKSKSEDLINIIHRHNLIS